MKKLSLKASCLCGGIQFRTKGHHRNVHNCHCIQCMKTHGHHAAYTAVKEQNIKFVKKRTLKWFRSSKKGKRGFCKKCGASVIWDKFSNEIKCEYCGNNIVKQENYSYNYYIFL